MANSKEGSKEGLTYSGTEGKGPYTPTVTPTDIGNLSGGEYNFLHSTAKPPAPPKK